MTEAHGKSKLIIKTQKVGQMIRISFTDDSPGTSEDDLKRLFDPFFTVKEIENGTGTGLGLGICYDIVESHSGHLHAMSKPGKGATLVIDIPVVSEGQPVA
jgi:signal transduction histidine kinase